MLCLGEEVRRVHVYCCERAVTSLGYVTRSTAGSVEHTTHGEVHGLVENSKRFT
jgi:hypothetical protein